MGSSFAARHAGRKPKTVPMIALVVTATTMRLEARRHGQVERPTNAQRTEATDHDA